MSTPSQLLLIHQNFPGQFRHLAPALVQRGDQVVALGILGGAPARVWNGVRVLSYRPQKANTPGLHPWLLDMESKTLRAEACWQAMRALKAQGFEPDVVLAHPGWGEPLFAKRVWPQARLALYAELFYRAHGADMGFDPEFAPADQEADACRLQMKNLNHLAHLDQADAAISPTQWQASTFPKHWRDRIFVSHDGIDTEVLRPHPEVGFVLPNGTERLTRKDEVVTFVSRHLEPYRGFHVFMRALPDLLRARPLAKVLVVGDDATGYGARAPDGQTWRQVFTQEVRAGISDADWSRVHFLGRLDRDRFTQLLQVSRVHVYLSYPFVLSWSLLEAMSVGAAIVASNVAPVREVIDHSEQGLLVDFFDEDLLVCRICELLDDPAKRVRLGANARRRAQERYDLNAICLPQQLKWIDRLLS
jgi:glycosyltransferase involved in cell wall biosynthesis